MDPRTRTALLITAVAVLALGLSAATLTSTVQSSADGGGGGGGGIHNPNIPDLDLDQPRGGDAPSVISRIIAVLFLLGAFALVLYALLYRKRAAAFLGLLVGAAVVFWLLIQVLSMFSVPDGVGGWFGGLSGLTGDGGELQSLRILALVVVAAGLGILAVYLFTGTDRNPLRSNSDQVDEETTETDDPTEMGEIAGRVADRIERQDGDEDLENQVYEAYSEMTAHLDVPSDDATTPREFAEAAAERGMADDDVSALTSLFEAVRYGGYAATADREQEAVETLRRIERRYTDE